MTRRTSPRHSPLLEPHAASNVRHHPYPGLQRRPSASQLHRLPIPAPPPPATSRRASHDLPLSPARPGETPMSGGSAFGQINLLADVAASQATTASTEGSSTPRRGRPATRSVSAARRDIINQRPSAWPAQGSADDKAASKTQWSNHTPPQPQAPPAMRRQQAPPPPLQYPLRPAHVAPVIPSAHPLAGLTLDREYAPYVPGKFEEDCRKVLHTPTLLYAPKPLPASSQARTGRQTQPSPANAQLPPQWPPQMTQVHGRANPDKGVGWIYPFNDTARPPSTRSPSHSFMTHAPLPRRPSQASEGERFGGNDVVRNSPPLSQDRGNLSTSVSKSQDRLRPVTTKYWALPTPVTSSQPDPISPKATDLNDMQVDHRSASEPMPQLTIPVRDLQGTRSDRHPDHRSANGSDMFLSPSPGDGDASMSGSDNGEFACQEQAALSRLSTRSHSSASSIASAPLTARKRPDAPSPTRSLPDLVYTPIQGAAYGVGHSMGDRGMKRKSLRNHEDRTRANGPAGHRRWMTASEGVDPDETARKLAELQYEVMRLKEENDTLKKKTVDGES